MSVYTTGCTTGYDSAVFPPVIHTRVVYYYYCNCLYSNFIFILGLYGSNLADEWMIKILTRNCLILFYQFSIETRKPCTWVGAFSLSFQIKNQLPKIYPEMHDV